MSRDRIIIAALLGVAWLALLLGAISITLALSECPYVVLRPGT